MFYRWIGYREFTMNSNSWQWRHKTLENSEPVFRGSGKVQKWDANQWEQVYTPRAYGRRWYPPRTIRSDASVYVCPVWLAQIYPNFRHSKIHCPNYSMTSLNYRGAKHIVLRNYQRSNTIVLHCHISFTKYPKSNGITRNIHVCLTNIFYLYPWHLGKHIYLFITYGFSIFSKCSMDAKFFLKFTFSHRLLALLEISTVISRITWLEFWVTEAF